MVRNGEGSMVRKRFLGVAAAALAALAMDNWAASAESFIMDYHPIAQISSR